MWKRLCVRILTNMHQLILLKFQRTYAIKTIRNGFFLILIPVGQLGHMLESITGDFGWSRGIPTVEVLLLRVRMWRLMKKVMLPFFKAMGAVTRAQRILLGAVDIECLKEYEKIVGRCLDARKSFETDEQKCFTLWACLVNVFTELHVDDGDVKNGWVFICLLGECENGDFCITELKRRFVHRVGSIGCLKSEHYEHFTLR